jgi:hypothetical protein
MRELKSIAYFPHPLGSVPDVAKPQGCCECGKCRSIFLPTSCIHAVVPEEEGTFRETLNDICFDIDALPL